MFFLLCLYPFGGALFAELPLVSVADNWTAPSSSAKGGEVSASGIKRAWLKVMNPRTSGGQAGGA